MLSSELVEVDDVTSGSQLLCLRLRLGFRNYRLHTRVQKIACYIYGSQVSSHTFLVQPLDDALDVAHFVEAFKMLFCITNCARAVIHLFGIRVELISEQVLVVWVQTLAFAPGGFPNIVPVFVC
jgi:hypothetical protein